MKQESFKQLFRKSKFVQYNASTSDSAQVVRTMMATTNSSLGVEVDRPLSGQVDTQFGMKRTIPQAEKSWTRERLILEKKTCTTTAEAESPNLEQSGSLLDTYYSLGSVDGPFGIVPMTSMNGKMEKIEFLKKLARCFGVKIRHEDPSHEQRVASVANLPKQSIFEKHQSWRNWNSFDGKQLWKVFEQLSSSKRAMEKLDQSQNPSQPLNSPNSLELSSQEEAKKMEKIFQDHPTSVVSLSHLHERSCHHSNVASSLFPLLKQQVVRVSGKLIGQIDPASLTGLDSRSREPCLAVLVNGFVARLPAGQLVETVPAGKARDAALNLLTSFIQKGHVRRQDSQDLNILANDISMMIESRRTMDYEYKITDFEIDHASSAPVITLSI